MGFDYGIRPEFIQEFLARFLKIFLLEILWGLLTEFLHAFFQGSPQRFFFQNSFKKILAGLLLFIPSRIQSRILLGISIGILSIFLKRIIQKFFQGFPPVMSSLPAPDTPWWIFSVFFFRIPPGILSRVPQAISPGIRWKISPVIVLWFL